MVSTLTAQIRKRRSLSRTMDSTTTDLLKQGTRHQTMMGLAMMTLGTTLLSLLRPALTTSGMTSTTLRREPRSITMLTLATLTMPDLTTTTTSKKPKGSQLQHPLPSRNHGNQNPH
ncbi:hypothetical protein SMACR_00629 [Sordaria macrospora]|uniref:Uncharacterized protein n=1 Tax=Sordaria macrospora TaxID=5147 RepID=A0A8S8ZV36_SORMA|nr:hypothetical protein SMACR_00629 [Sordaria macrospora]